MEISAQRGCTAEGMQCKGPGAGACEVCGRTTGRPERTEQSGPAELPFTEMGVFILDVKLDPFSLFPKMLLDIYVEALSRERIHESGFQGGGAGWRHECRNDMRCHRLVDGPLGMSADGKQKGREASTGFRRILTDMSGR